MSLTSARVSQPRSTWLILAGVAFVIFIANEMGLQAAPPPKSSTRPAPAHHAPPPVKHAAPPVHHAPPTVKQPPAQSHHHTPGPVRTTPNIPRINIVNPPLSGYTVPHGGYNPLPQPVLPVQPVQPGGNYAPPNVQVRTNPLPPAKQPAAAPLKPNQPPETSPKLALKPNVQLAAYAVSYDDLVAAFNAIQDEQQQKLDEIKDGLGPEMLADPAVAAAIDTIQTRIDNGEQISDAEIDDLINSVTNANNNGIPVTGGLDPFTAIQTLGGIQALGELQQLVGQYPPGGLAIPIPTGLVDLITDPFLPADFVAVLPSGAILDGTGGVGGFGVSQGTLAQAAGLPPGVGDPVPASSADPNDRTTSGLLIMNPAVNGVGIEYVVNDQNYTTPSGYNQNISGGGSWLAQFNRGPGFGDARYNLTEGTYYFASTDHGWELYRRDFSVTISNAENPKSFEYVVDNTNTNVAGGQSQTHDSKYPMLIRFDRGGGNQPAQKKISDPTVGKAQLRVAINTADNLWDLYPAKNFAAATAIAADGAPAPGAAPGATSAPSPTATATTAAAATVQFAPIPAAKQAKVKLPAAPAAKPKKLPTWSTVAKTATKLPAAPVPTVPVPAPAVPAPEPQPEKP